MKYLFALLLILMTSVAGCKSYEIPQACKEHPAHPQAFPSTDVKQGAALEVDNSNLPRIPPEMKNRKMEH